MASVLQSTGEVASSQMKNDFSILNRLDEASFSNFNEIIFDFLLTSKQPETLIARLTEFSAELGLGLSTLKSSVRSELALLRAAGKHGITGKNLQEDLEKLGNEIE